jgi:RNA polymerase-binding transcription factor DksA
MTDTRAIADQLHARLAELTSRIETIEADLRQPLAADSEEQAVDREGDEVLEGLEQASLDEIMQIKGALDRIANGSYGDCTSCGEPIADARLKAMPTASRCMNCAG